MITHIQQIKVKTYTIELLIQESCSREELLKSLDVISLQSAESIKENKLKNSIIIHSTKFAVLNF